MPEVEVTPVPNPGSTQAVMIGCLCPRMDNCWGEGCYRDKDGEPVFIINNHCPLHGEGPQEDVVEIPSEA